MSEKSQLKNRFIAWIDTNSIAIITGIATLIMTITIVYAIYTVIQFCCPNYLPVAPVEQGRGE